MTEQTNSGPRRGGNSWQHGRCDRRPDPRHQRHHRLQGVRHDLRPLRGRGLRGDLRARRVTSVRPSPPPARSPSPPPPLDDEAVRAAVDEAGYELAAAAEASLDTTPYLLRRAVPPADTAPHGPVRLPGDTDMTSTAPARRRAARPDLRRSSSPIGGMTCASCAARIEKKLNRMDGVTATVNYATEKAKVTFAGGVDVADLIATVEAPATPPSCPPPPQPGRATRRRRRAGRRPTPDAELHRAAPAAARSAAARRARRRAGDGPGAAVRQLAVALAHPGRAGRRLGRAGPSTGPPGPTSGTAPPPWTPSSPSARSPRFGWSLWALFFGDAGMPGMKHRFELTVARRRRRRQHLPRGRRRRHRVHPRRPLLRGPRQAAGRAPRCAPCWSWAPRTSPCCADGGEVRIPIAELAVGDRFVVRPGEKIATDGDGRRGHLGRRRLDADRRVRAGRGRAGRRRHRRHRQRRRPAGRARPPGSAPTPSSPGWPGWSRTRRTARPPVQRLADRISGGLRARRHRARRWPPSAFWLGDRRTADRRVHRRRRRADHRLPVRLGPGHADRAAGRHRPRRAARHPHQGPRGAGVHPPGRHGRAGQDRHRHHRPHDARRTSYAADGGDERRAAAAGGRAGARLRAPHRPGDRRAAPTERAGGLPGAGDFAERRRASASRASSTATPSLVGRERLAGRVGDRAAATSWPDAKAAAEADGRTAVAVAWDGQARGVLVVADTVKPTSAEAVAELRGLGLTPVLLTGDNQRVAEPVAAEVGIDDGDRRGPARRTRSTSSSGCRARAGSVAMVGDGVNDAAALAQRRPRPRHGHRHRRRHRGRRPHPRPRRPAGGRRRHPAVPHAPSAPSRATSSGPSATTSPPSAGRRRPAQPDDRRAPRWRSPRSSS